jgi:hypothetical protein
MSVLLSVKLHFWKWKQDVDNEPDRWSTILAILEVTKSTLEHATQKGNRHLSSIPLSNHDMCHLSVFLELNHLQSFM